MSDTTRSESRRFIASLMAGEVTPLPDREIAWPENIQRLHVEGRIVEVEEVTYDYFLDVLPPRFMWGNLFAFCEGYDRFLLFWQMNGRYFARQLSEQETETFCRFTGSSRME